MMISTPVWTTPAARDRLAQELADLERRAEIGEDVDGARMLQLRDTLRNAEVDRKPDDGLVEAGMTVTIRFGNGSTTTFLLGDRELASLDPDVAISVYAPTSPLGSAISGRYVQDAVTFDAPSGPLQVTILAAVPFG